jgi:DNA-binding IclR family transcriptional regulator
VFVADGATDWTYSPVAGDRVPLHVTAPGKAILATLDEERVTEIVERYGLAAATEATITDPDVLLDQLRRIREDGVSFCREEQFVDTVGVAAPIRTDPPARSLALGVVGPTDRLSGRYLEEDVTGQVLSTANAVQVELAGQT